MRSVIVSTPAQVGLGRRRDHRAGYLSLASPDDHMLRYRAVLHGVGANGAEGGMAELEKVPGGAAHGPAGPPHG